MKTKEEILDTYKGSIEYPQLITRSEAEDAMQEYADQFIKPIVLPPIVVPKGYWNCGGCEMDYDTGSLCEDSKCPVCGITRDMVLVEDHPVIAEHESKEVESVPVKSAYQILDDAIGFATLEIKDNDYENVIEAMENYASQFKQPANNESLEKKALKYANDFVFPIKGVEYGYSYLQELKAQRDLIKDAYMAGAANNDAVKVIEERIKELEATPTGWQDSERIILIEELKHILKLIQ